MSNSQALSQDSMANNRPVPKRKWFVARTQPNAENKASFHLTRQGFDVYLPRYLRRVSHARKVTWQPRPLFPAYLFVAVPGPEQRWRAINSTIGIAHLICDSRGPVPVPPGIVETIMEQEDDRGLVLTGRKIPFKKGAEIQVMTGAFADQIGCFESITDDQRVVILLDLMGRQVRTTVKLDAISAHA